MRSGSRSRSNAPSRVLTVRGRPLPLNLIWLRAPTRPSVSGRVGATSGRPRANDPTAINAAIRQLALSLRVLRLAFAASGDICAIRSLTGSEMQGGRSDSARLIMTTHRTNGGRASPDPVPPNHVGSEIEVFGGKGAITMGTGSQPRPHGRTDAMVSPKSAPLKGKSPTGAKSMPPLSSHEFSVLVLVRNGLTTKELASQLGISINTAKYHLTNIYRKLGAQNRVEASNAYDQLVERSSSARVRTILEWGTRLAASIASPIPRSRAAYVLIEDGMAIPIIEIDSLNVSSGRQFPLAENHHFSEIVSSRQPRVSMVGTRPLGPIAHSSVAAIAVTAGAGVPIVMGDSVHGVLAIGVRGTELPIEVFRRLVDLGRLVELALTNAPRKSR